LKQKIIYNHSHMIRGQHQSLLFLQRYERLLLQYKQIISVTSLLVKVRVFAPFCLTHMIRGQHQSLLFQQRYESLPTCNEKRLYQPLLIQ
jgi:hypothetical protein